MMNANDVESIYRKGINRSKVGLIGSEREVARIRLPKSNSVLPACKDGVTPPPRTDVVMDSVMCLSASSPLTNVLHSLLCVISPLLRLGTCLSFIFNADATTLVDYASTRSEENTAFPRPPQMSCSLPSTPL